MYKVIIADDESWVAKGLKKCIEWERLGFEVIGYAKDGPEALELIRLHKPELVFTDIRMPGMSGLELIKKVSEEGMDTEFVVISGYAEFAYAQKAMNSGAVGFCLKPFDEQEVTGILRKIKHRRDNRVKSSLESVLAEALDPLVAQNETEILHLLEQLGMRWDAEKGIFAVVMAGEGEIRWPADACKICLGERKQRRYLVQGMEPEVLVSFLESQLTGQIRSIGIEGPQQSVAGIVTALEKAGLAAYMEFITGRPGVYSVEAEEGARELYQFTERIDKAVSILSPEEIEAVFHEITGFLTAGRCSVRQLFHFYNTVAYFTLCHGGEPMAEIFFTYEQLAASFPTAAELMVYLKKSLMETIEVREHETIETVRNETVRAIVQYIRDNFDQELSIQELSARFFVNVTYFSYLFKKEVGETFTEYICSLRIKKACELLSGTQIPVYEVAEKVGYKDYFHFAKLFKRATGQTPTQYRDAHS